MAPSVEKVDEMLMNMAGTFEYVPLTEIIELMQEESGAGVLSFSLHLWMLMMVAFQVCGLKFAHFVVTRSNLLLE